MKALLCVLIAMTTIQAASIWYTGENKPYDFGYAIEGNQHRRESKDANGIIMGEFGFITADDVYHVTVYATDENGNFKVLSMKNIKLFKGLPTSTTTSTTPQPFKLKTTAAAPKACASCKIPPKAETETVKPTASDATDVPPPFKVVSKDEISTTEAPITSTVPPVESLPQKIVNANSGSPPTSFGSNQSGGDARGPSLTPANRQPALNQKLNMPQLFNKQGGNVDHYNKLEKMMNGLLYRFNYTTDYQGHREEGDRAGNKEGEYYTVGRDNVKRIVSYKANEFGFMPYIRQEPLQSQDLQYYDEKNNRLRYSKFEWFYP